MIASRVAQVFAEEWPLLVATLRRDLGDLDLAEDAAQDAFVEAAARWGPTTTPNRPGAWLLTTARRRAIDRIRHDRRFAERLPALAELAQAPPRPAEELVDDQLALIFGCCHPALDPASRMALTLREVCGLSTGQIAASFLVPMPTLAKRLVRAKAKIRTAGVPFVVPAREQLPGRCAEVLRVIYLIFTEGHTATAGPTLVRGDLCDEARWLAGLLAELLAQLPASLGTQGDHERTVALAEALGLQALMLFTDARRDTRLDASGRLVLLEHQDRSRWNRALIGQGQAVLSRALALGHVGAYQLEAAIAGLHATAADWAHTDWAGIRRLYEQLLVVEPSDVVALNAAVATSMLDGPQAGLAAVETIAARGDLADYRYLHAARADLLRRLGRPDEAALAYRRALELTANEAEVRYLADRLASCLDTDPDQRTSPDAIVPDRT
ncbi:MAG: sigma-70 family RNA polymerase sigma factor [Kineosporiaceae bacterium]